MINDINTDDAAVNRVARAIFLTRYGAPARAWDDVKGEPLENYRVEARAAIKAMQEPVAAEIEPAINESPLT